MPLYQMQAGAEAAPPHLQVSAQVEEGPVVLFRHGALLLLLVLLLQLVLEVLLLLGLREGVGGPAGPGGGKS